MMKDVNEINFQKSFPITTLPVSRLPLLQPTAEGQLVYLRLHIVLLDTFLTSPSILSRVYSKVSVSYITDISRLFYEDLVSLVYGMPGSDAYMYWAEHDGSYL